MQTKSGEVLYTLLGPSMDICYILSVYYTVLYCTQFVCVCVYCNIKVQRGSWESFRAWKRRWTRRESAFAVYTSYHTPRVRLMHLPTAFTIPVFEKLSHFRLLRILGCVHFIVHKLFS